MCGLTGYWMGGGGEASGFEEQVARMAGTLVHRGPDDSGTWVDAECGIALGFRRLAILDLTPAGHQPMHSGSARYVIVFNGEIYNFAELREELEALGHKFRGTSDTEVMLAAIEQWGIERATRRFAGMFAFALWDRKERSLSLVRDRSGEKPLYYGWAGQTFLFGSELKALRAHRDFRAEVDRGALTLFLRHGAVPAPYTIYKGIRQLPPGCIVHITAPASGAACPQPYWSLRDVVEKGAREPFAGSSGEATDRLDALLRDVVRLRMIADVPLGAFLSGGIDSSTVVSLMQAQSSRPVRTFSIGFEEAGFDEAPHAKAVATHLGTEHTEMYVTSAQAQAVIPGLPEIYDEPFADSSQIPTLILSQLTRRSVTVSLSGDGGDELFAGYNRYPETERLWRKLRRIPARLRLGIGTCMRALGKGSRVGRRLHHLSDVFEAKTPEALYRRMLSHWKTPAAVVIGGFEPSTIFTEPARWPPASDLTGRMQFFDSSNYLPDDIFTKVDRASMAVSLEARVPLVDHGVVEFAWSLPRSLKVRGERGKWILREVLNRYVPAALVERPKMGFGVPIGAWLRGPLRDWAGALLDERRLREEGYFHPTPVREKWTEHLGGKHNWEYYLWNVLMFQAWLERWG